MKMPRSLSIFITLVIEFHLGFTRLSKVVISLDPYIYFFFFLKEKHYFTALIFFYNQHFLLFSCLRQELDFSVEQ